MLWMTELPPFVPFFVGALLVAVSRGRLQQLLLLAIPLLGGWHLWLVPEGIHWQLEFLGYQLQPYRADRLSLLFGYLFHIAAFIAILYALHLKDKLQLLAGLLYAGSALGAVFAGDLLTLFVFWELLALTSVFLIWARRTPASRQAGFRYLLVQITSGLLLLAGTLGYAAGNNSLQFNHLGLSDTFTGLIFIAFGIKAAFPLLHSWLVDAYPEATPAGTVFLSAFTTKVAVYALARGFVGTELLVYIGAVMTCFPIFYAVIENDLRRVLAYSLINQLGFMICGIGIGTELALNGAVAHAFNDVIFKGLLFMSMGAVLTMTGKINGSELGGLYKTMPKTTLLCLVGAASISAFPLFSGFVSKSMVMTAALQQDYHGIWLMLLFASAGVFHHAGIKIPYFAFFAHDSGLRASDPPANMLLAMLTAAALCLGIGIYPALLYQWLPFSLDYQPYDVTHVLAQTQLLFFSALAFVWLNLRGLYPPELPSTNLDADWLYRRLVPGMFTPLFEALWRLDARCRQWCLALGETALAWLMRQRHGTGLLANNTGAMVSWIIVLLASYLLLSFI